MPTEHSNIMGGSTSEQRINCPGSYQLEAKMPKKPPTEHTERGSMLHSGTELVLVQDPQNIKDCEPLLDELEGQDLGYDGQQITRELINTKLRPALEAWFDVKQRYGFVDWFIEERVSLEAVIKGAFGTADIIAIDKDGRLHVLDWKFGDGVPVDVVANYGAGFYAAATLYDPDPELRQATIDVKDIVLHIVQPRANHPNEPVLQTWETDIDWVEDLIDLAVDAVEKAQSDNPPTKTGKWCRWCTAKPICPEYGRMANEALETKPEIMDPIELAAALSRARLLKVWIDSIFELAQQQMEKGVAIPGNKLVQKQARRKWINEKDAEQAMRKARFKVSEIFTKKIISPTQAEKLNKKVYSNTLSNFVESKSSGLTVAEDTDDRPAVSSGVNLLASKLENTDTKQITLNS